MLDQTPHQLRDFDQWILWKQEVREGKPTKVPCHVSGRPASVTDPAAWHTYLDAIQAYADSDGALSGVGFCFTPDDPFVGVDLDGCFPRMAQAAREILRRLPSYAEISPSGTGIKVFAAGDIAEYTRSRTSEVPGFKQLEVYHSGRFFTVTGQRFGSYPDVNECQAGLDWLMETYLPNPEQAVVREGAGTGVQTEDDAELLDVMYSFANGEDARRLYAGDMSRYDDDHSTADLALVGYLAFVCGPDPDRIDTLFRGSALMRDKWDARRGDSTYGERTIEKVLDEATDFYTPPRRLTAEDLGDLAKIAFPADASATVPSRGVEQPVARDSHTVEDTGSSPVTAIGAGEADVSSGSTMEGGGHPIAADPPPIVGSAFPIPEQGIIRDIVDLMGPHTESPDSTLALASVVMLSAVTGWSRWFEWGESREPCIMYACITGKSAMGKKTTGMRSIESLFTDAGFDLQMASGGHVSGRGLVETAIGGDTAVFYVKEPKIEADEYLPGPIDGERIRNPEWEQQNADWASWHETRRKLLEEPPSVVLVWDEFGKMLNVEQDWQRDTRAELLSMFNGTHRGVKTSGKGGIAIPAGKVSMSMIATMTDDELVRSLNAGQITDGLMGRILFSPPGATKPPLPRPPRKGPEYAERREAIIRKLLQFKEMVEWPKDAWEGWADDALETWDRWYAGRFATSQGMEALLFARGQATAAKMAVLFSLAELSPTVEVRHVEYAIRVLEASLAHAIECFEQHIEAQRDRYTDAVLALVLTEPQPLSKILERGMLGGKEPGETMPTREERVVWIDRDPRLKVEKSKSGKGHVVAPA